MMSGNVIFGNASRRVRKEKRYELYPNHKGKY